MDNSTNRNTKESIPDTGVKAIKKRQDARGRNE